MFAVVVSDLKMAEQILPPSPNWFLTTVASCSLSGVLAYGVRNGIVVIDSVVQKEAGPPTIKMKALPNAHREKVTSVSFSKRTLPDSGLATFPLASASEDGSVMIWNMTTMKLAQEHREHVSVEFLLIYMTLRNFH